MTTRSRAMIAASRTRAGTVFCGMLLAAGAVTAHAHTISTPTRVGDHAGFGRVVFDLPADATYDTVTEGNRLLVVFQGAGPVEAAPRLPRNVVALQTATDSATLQLAPGAQPHLVRMGNRLVIDVAGPPNRREIVAAPVKESPPAPEIRRTGPHASSRKNGACGGLAAGRVWA